MSDARQAERVPEADRARLARYVRERREELGLNQEHVAARGGPSVATLRLVENSAPINFKRKTVSQLESALDWEPGSVRAILAGREPVIPAATSGAHRSRATGEPVGVELFTTIASAAFAKGLSAAEVTELAAKVGVPGRDRLDVEDWSLVASTLNVTLGWALHNLAGVSSGDLKLTSPSRPPARASSSGGQERRRALPPAGGLVNRCGFAGPLTATANCKPF